MALTALTNTAALQAQKGITEAQKAAERAGTRIALGTRIVRASDDTASAAINNKVSSLIAGLKQAISNTSQGAALLQVATGGLGNLSDILTRMRVLATQVNSEVLGQEERDFANLELQQLVTEFDDIVNQTRFNGSNLLTGGATTITQSPALANATMTRDAGQSITSNTFAGTINAAASAGAIDGTASVATVTANATAGNDYTLTVDTGRGLQTFTATGVTAVAGGTLDLTNANGNVISFDFDATDVSALASASVADTAFKQLVSLTPGSTAATFVSASEVFNTVTGIASVDSEASVANGKYTLIYDSQIPTVTPAGVTGEAILNAGAPPATTMAGTLNAASTGSFSGTWVATRVTGNGPYNVEIDVDDGFGNIQTFANAAFVVADGGNMVLTSTTNADNVINLDQHANATTGMTNAAQVLAALEAMRTGGAQTASFTSTSTAYGATGLANVTTTTGFANGQYTVKYVGTTEDGGNERIDLIDGTGTIIDTVDLNPILGGISGTTQTFTVGTEQYSVTFGAGIVEANSFFFRWDSTGSSANGTQLHLDDGRGTRETLTNLAPASNNVYTFPNSKMSVTLGSGFNVGTDIQTTFTVSEQTTFTFQVADKASDTITVNIDAVGASNVNITGIDILSIANAQDALDKVAVALNEVNSVYATLGAQQKRLEIAESNAGTTVENLVAAKSTFYDADIPAELTNRTIADVNMRTSIAMLASANQQSEAILAAAR